MQATADSIVTLTSDVPFPPNVAVRLITPRGDWTGILTSEEDEQMRDDPSVNLWRILELAG